MHAETQPSARIILVEGTFDREAALALCVELLETACELVVLDFARAREVSDVALAVLAHSIAELHPRVILRGLSQHHERLLRYLRVPASLADVA